MSPAARILTAAVVAACATGGAWVAVATGKPTIAIRVEGRRVGVVRGTTLAAAARRFGIEPHPGGLLDVDGKVLRAGRFPGRLTVNGRPATGTTLLRPGDRVGAENGPDRTEPTERETVPARLRRPANPQFFVDLVPGRSIVTRGAVSHLPVSGRFVPDGPPVPDDAVALTFDDGPSQYTRPLLSLLAELHVPATFFVVGTQVEEHPELVQLEVGAGMAVGNHSWDHPWRTPFAELPRATIRAEIGRNEAILDRLGTRTVLFRPPGGTVSPVVLAAAAAHGLRIVLWSVDARDWAAGATAETIERRVLGSVGPGSIVLMHDGGGNREATLEALPAIVAGIRARGLRLVSLAPQG
jgi:peptidoglycan/xylan/chitin deacetylase (PgdA/CDA1 family)